MIIRFYLLCRVGLHLWGKWSEPYSVNLIKLLNGAKIKDSDFAENRQSRVCAGCGIKQERRVDAKV